MNRLGILIKNKLTTLGISEREMSQRCKVSHSYLNQLIKGVNPKTGKKINPTLVVVEKLAAGLEVPKSEIENALMMGNRDEKIKKLEEKSGSNGINIGSEENRNIPPELWDKIKHAQDFMMCLGLDPSKHNEEDWKLILDDLKLIVETHLRTPSKKNNH